MLPVGQRPAAGFVHAQAGVLISCYSLSPYKVIHAKTHMNDDRPPVANEDKEGRLLDSPMVFRLQFFKLGD